MTTERPPHTPPTPRVPVSAPGSSPLGPAPAPKLGPAPRRERRERRGVLAHLSAPGACLQCRYTAPGRAGAPCPRRRRRLRARPAGSHLASSSARPAPSPLVPRLFSSPSPAAPAQRASSNVGPRDWQGSARGQRAQNNTASQVNSSLIYAPSTF